jgi:ferredoxin-nitrite reductase
MSVDRSICPDIYHPAVARDGLLTRLRIPGGILNVAQCHAIVDLLETTGLDYLQVTNRANIQLRGLGRDLEPELLARLIACGLVAANQSIDGIRNIMASPLAGIDPTELIDVRPLVVAWDNYLREHPELGVLSNKFSVGFDGGGSVSILDRPNDITLLAVSKSEFLLHLAMGKRGDAPVPVLLGESRGGIQLAVPECISILGSIAQSYRRGIEELGGDTQHKLRLRDVIDRWWGLAVFFKVVREEIDLLCLGVRLTERYAEVPQRHTEEGLCRHLGVWAQKQVWANELKKFVSASYVGVALPLGRLNAAQINGLADIARQYGSGEIRLTPWQNAIVPDVRDEDVDIVRRSIDKLGLSTEKNHVSGLLMACAGASGCQYAATDTQGDALALAEDLESKFELDTPVNIHFSGCDKSCAQHYRADISLWGCPKTDERASGYRLCIGGGDDKFGRELKDYLTPEDVRLAIDRLIRAYQEQRTNPQESFRAFSHRQSLAQLQQVLNVIRSTQN